MATKHERTQIGPVVPPSWLGTVRTRLQNRQDSEHEQAVLRIVIVGLVLAYMAGTYRPETNEPERQNLVLLAGLSADLVFAFGIFAAICVWPAVNQLRRVAGMLSDAGTATFVMFMTGEAGISMIGVYLFITFGNGFRYGRRYLFACQMLCLIGFLAVLLYDDFWRVHQVAGWSLMVALVVLPLYVSTLLKRIEEARARAVEASRAKSTFLANMSHEMRTPLNGIVGIVDLMQTTALSLQQGELMRLLRHSVSLLRALVDDVLDISKIEAGRLSVEIADFDLHAMLNGLVGLLRPHAREKGLKLNALVDPSIDFRLRGDHHHLRQVLLNLLSNAIKFTEKGEVNISVTLAAETTEGVRLRFEIRDTGIGIADDVQSGIFERFVQADSSTTRRYGGTGLGTTIAKELVELMGGAIGLKSKLGVGSTFWLEVPLLKPTILGADCETAAGAVPVVGTALLVAKPATASRLEPLLAAVCGPLEVASHAQEAIETIRRLRERGALRAVFVADELEGAVTVFESLAAEVDNAPAAMVYVANATSSYHDVQAGLRHVEGVITMMPEVTPRLVRNAIHAATPGEGLGGQVIDLDAVLREQRQRLKVLVAEDNSTNRAIIRQLLESAGHEVVMGVDGEDALDAFERESPDLAILDYNMPERNGLDVMRAIRISEAPGEHLPIVILSASVTPETRQTAKLAGADEFVGKPYEAAALLKVIDRLARRVSRTPQTRSREAGGVALPVISTLLVDPKRLADVERIAGNDAFLGQLLRGFRDDVSRLLVKLESAIANRDTSAVLDATHAIKGASLGIGAIQLSSRCEAIDSAAVSGRVEALKDLVIELERCYSSTSSELEVYSSRKHRALR